MSLNRTFEHQLTLVQPLEPRCLLSLDAAGPEFRVNEYTPDDQRNTSVAVDADGNFVVLWTSYGQDGSDAEVYGRRFNATGVPRGAEFRVNTYTTGFQGHPAVAMNDDGDFVVAWDSRYQDGSEFGVYAQRYSADGLPQGGEFRANTFVTQSQRYAAVAIDDDGDFVVVWSSYQQQGSQGFGLFAQRYDADGSRRGDEFRVNMYTTGSHEYPAVASNGAGGVFVITWSALLPGGTEYDVLARRFQADGSPAGDEFQVNTYTPSVQANSSVAVSQGGGFAIAWNSYMQDGSDYGVFARHFDAQGQPAGAEYRVNQHTTNAQSLPSIAVRSDGQFLVAWQSRFEQGPVGDYDIYARRLVAAGGPHLEAFRINTHTTSTQAAPSVAMTAAGDAVVSWHSFNQDGSRYGVIAQQYALVPHVAASSLAFQTIPHRIQFVFDENVSASLGTEDVSVQNITTSQTISSTDFAIAYDLATNTATFSYLANAGVLPDGNYRATLLASGITTPNGQHLPADYVLDFHFLTGDANGDGRVNLTDFNILAANFGQSPRDFTQGDFNYDGVVNLIDFNILAGRFGAQLEPMASPATAQAQSRLGRPHLDDDLEDLMS